MILYELTKENGDTVTFNNYLEAKETLNKLGNGTITPIEVPDGYVECGKASPTDMGIYLG